MTDAPLFPLAACSEMLFRDLPYLERVRRIHDLGFQVEMWDWTSKDLDALVAIGATWSTMTGYIHGDLYDAEGGELLLSTAKRSVAAAKRIGCPRLVVHGAELDGSRGGRACRPQAVTTGRMWLNAYRTLEKLADLAETNDVVFCLENLNTRVDHPGVPFGRAEDTITLVELVRRAGALIGEVQVADVPGRCEPGTGEINWPAVAAALAQSGYQGTVGLEAWAAGDDIVALERFRAAFSRRAEAPPAG